MNHQWGALVGVLILGGCGGSEVRYADRTVTAAMLQNSIEHNHERVRSLSGSGVISVETADMAQSGSFELTLKKPDSLLVKLEGPFGINVGSALVTRNEFSFYNSFQNKLLQGPTTSANLDRLLHVKLDFNDVLNLFLGGIFLDEDRSTPTRFTIEDEEFVLTFDRSTGTRRYWVDPQTTQIVKIQHLDGTGKLVVEQIFSKFHTVNGVTLPHYVRVTMMRAQRRVSVAYEDVVVNPAFLSFRFEVPPTASKGRLE